MATSHFADISALSSSLGYDVGDALDDYKWTDENINEDEEDIVDDPGLEEP